MEAQAPAVVGEVLDWSWWKDPQEIVTVRPVPLSARLTVALSQVVVQVEVVGGIMFGDLSELIHEKCC